MNVRRYDHHDAGSIIPEDKAARVLGALTMLTFEGSPTTATLRQSLLMQLYAVGWSQRAKLDPSSGITITSVSGNTGLCLQTGNAARMYADMLKLQLLFHRTKISAAILIVFGKASGLKVGQNLTSYERLVKELQIFIDVITVPILVYGLEGAQVS